MKYRKKPIEVEAVKVVYQEMLRDGPEGPPVPNAPEWFNQAVRDEIVTLSTRGARDYAVLDVDTGHGIAEATPGDYIVRGVEGELYPCDGKIFEATYEEAEAVDAVARE